MTERNSDCLDGFGTDWLICVNFGKCWLSDITNWLRLRGVELASDLWRNLIGDGDKTLLPIGLVRLDTGGSEDRLDLRTKPVGFWLGGVGTIWAELVDIRHLS